MGLMFAPLKRAFDFSGRSRRKEYWLFVLFVWVLLFILLYLDSAFGLGGTATSYSGMDPEGGASVGFKMTGGYLSIAWLVLAFIPGLSVSIRRLHDQDKAGWWVLVPIANFIMVMFIGGTAGPNRFGPDPKGGPAPVSQAFT